MVAIKKTKNVEFVAYEFNHSNFFCNIRLLHAVFSLSILAIISLLLIKLY